MNITVYCGASEGLNNIYREKTIKLGQWIAKKNYNLVYGGGKVGLMGAIADTVILNEGKVIGIIPKFLEEREIAHTGISELISVDNMSERKYQMIELGDAFIALPGGPGTLEEITEVISWARIGKNNSPCILYNINGYFDNLRAMYDSMVSEGFLTQDDRNKILFTTEIVEIEDFIMNYKAPEIRRY
ncbi:TIGR00730 family Rossman fold protein [Lactococcus lactis]|uniref:LOG family protein n=1 Tax=Lactococcus lactis TaxID=1358 RepID=UPI0006400F48|nr:TIGR00730 family Rossman fold protein [Lactococcus lactis]KLK96659.1 TIGR00730 family protein [Lactococcus lactis subsp. lactis]KST84246.1 Lysine decarboxylase family [Lactococcus lactis subsp. lactis]MBU7533406.1 TIGR00730 family Rossman fold protein [Lactococcus lactis]MCT1171884.1 TIGR00730 family Rossman fold protein [Lactococcus lactis]MDV4193096.1 TIGR00730 family Rossman fold protein [Lactococcus lactis subsp. lactis]